MWTVAEARPASICPAAETAWPIGNAKASPAPDWNWYAEEAAVFMPITVLAAVTSGPPESRTAAPGPYPAQPPARARRRPP